MVPNEMKRVIDILIIFKLDFKNGFDGSTFFSHKPEGESNILLLKMQKPIKLYLVPIQSLPS